MSVSFSLTNAQWMAANIRLLPSVPLYHPRPAKHLEKAYVVIGVTDDGSLDECVRAYVYEKPSVTRAWISVTNGAVSWAATGSARGGGYKREQVAIGDAACLLAGGPLTAGKNGEVSTPIADVLAALAIAAGYMPKLVIEI